MNVAILVPRRADGGHRDRLWDFARKRWETDFPDWPIIEGHHNTGPFDRSAALNTAAREASDWDVAVVIDADVLANRDAARTAVDVAAATGRMVVSHNERVMLTREGTKKVLAGYTGSWRARGIEERTYTDSVSCCVAIPRKLWDLVGGFDERFSGWGYEDTAFEITAETLSGETLIRLTSELFHLHHAVSPEAGKDAPTRKVNAERLAQYRAARGDREAIRRLIAPLELNPTRIPRILHRTVPAETSDEVETWWAKFQQLHPEWDCRTHRDPLDPADWPLTSDLWGRCANGAQKAGLIRLEALFTHGGIYVDSDVEPFRSLEALLCCEAFAGWEDETTVPDAILGARSGHPAFGLMLEKARTALTGGGDAWQTGPGVTTEVLPNRSDVLLLPPGAFYEAHYLEKRRLSEPNKPYEFARHHWHHSWGSDAQKRSIEKRQR